MPNIQTLQRMNGALPDVKSVKSDAGDALGFEAPFQVLAPEKVAAPVIFSSPHSGCVYPSAVQSMLRVPLMDLRRTEDAFVDELFNDAPNFGAWLVAANYGRMIVDLNRDPRELDAKMFSDGPPRICGIPTARVAAGLGCLPNVASRGDVIYNRLLTKAEGEARLRDIHDVWHTYLAVQLAELKKTYGAAILVDCHSMPSVQPGRRHLADIVLGDRFGSSCDHRLTSRVERAFRGFGLTVARNAPYAGGYMTRKYGRPKRGLHALQIEINRGLYMDERLIQRNERFAEMRTIAASIIREVLDVSKDILTD